MALACIWRRRQPLWFLIAVVALVFPLSSNLAPASSLLTAVYVGLLPAYAVAAWEDRQRALLGLAILVLASAVGELLIRQIGAANYAPSLFTICAAWAAGRAIRARRAMDADASADDVPAGGRARRSRAAGGCRRALADRARPARSRRAQRRGDGRPGRSGTRHSSTREPPQRRTRRWRPSRTSAVRRSTRCAGSWAFCASATRPASSSSHNRASTRSTGSSSARASMVNRSNSPSRASPERCLPASTSGSTESSKTRWPAFVRIRLPTWASHCASKRRTSSCSSPRRTKTRVTGRPTRCANACCCAAAS